MVHGSSLWLWPWPWPGPWSWSWPCPWPAKGHSCQATALCWRAMAMARLWSTWLYFLYAERKQKAYKFDRQKLKTLSSRNRSHRSWNIRASSDRRAELHMPSGKLRITPALVCAGGWRQLMSKDCKKHSFSRICSIFDFCAQQALALFRVTAQ